MDKVVYHDLPPWRRSNHFPVLAAYSLMSLTSFLHSIARLLPLASLVYHVQALSFPASLPSSSSQTSTSIQPARICWLPIISSSWNDRVVRSFHLMHTSPEYCWLCSGLAGSHIGPRHPWHPYFGWGSRNNDGTGPSAVRCSASLSSLTLDNLRCYPTL